jgi:hypothetical protein
LARTPLESAEKNKKLPKREGTDEKEGTKALEICCCPK